MKTLASQVLATLLVNAFLVVGSLCFASLAVVSGVVRPRSTIPYRCAQWWAGWLVRLAGIRLDVRFEDEDLDPDGRYVFFANHQSLYDIPVLLDSLPVRARFLAKRSLFVIPLFGRAMRTAGFVPVDRGGGASAAKRAMRDAGEQLEQGHSILLFPEETRSPDGRILSFKTGGLLIALRAGVPIVPVGLSGTRKVRPKGSFLVRPGAVRVRYGRPVDPSARGVRGKRELLDQLREEIARLSGEELVPDGEPRPASTARTGAASAETAPGPGSG